MATTKQELLDFIIGKIFENNQGRITATNIKDILVGIVDKYVPQDEVVDILDTHTSQVDELVTEYVAQIEQIKDQATNAAGVSSSEYEDKGPYNANLNIPTLSGSYNTVGLFKQPLYSITVSGSAKFAGTNFISGSILNIGDQLRGISGSWYRLPFAIGENVISTTNIRSESVTIDKLEPNIKNLVQPMHTGASYMYAIVDSQDRKALGITSDGWIDGKFRLTESLIPSASIGNDKIKMNAVDLFNLSSSVRQLIPSNFDNTYSKYSIMWLDEANRIALGIQKDGGVTGKFIVDSGSTVLGSTLSELSVTTSKIASASITLDKISTDARDQLGSSEKFNNDTSDLSYAILDSQGRIGFAIKKDGSIVGKLDLQSGSIKGYQIANGVITADHLSASVINRLPSDSFIRVNNISQYDVSLTDDMLWRGTEIEIPARTLSGSFSYTYQQFPPAKTRILKGYNNTGTSITFKELSGLPIRGKQNMGTFNPSGSVQGTLFRGIYGDSYNDNYPAFPSGNTGDCWIIDAGNTVATKTANSLTFKNGDMLVKTSSGYDIQSGPGDGTYNILQQRFWTVTQNGTFGGVTYAIGDKIYILGLQSNSGPKYIKYGKSKPGELFIMGECNGSFAPSTSYDGDAYIYSADSTASGIVGKTGDILIYRGAWGLLQSRTIVIPNGQSYYLPCNNASDWGIRRTDKGTSHVNVLAYGHSTTLRLKSNDNIRLISDSMFGVSQVGQKVLTISGRTGAVQSYGGGTSEDVLSMMRNNIITNTDIYAGNVHVMWHGQNNASDTLQVKAAAYQMADLVGSINSRFCFWSVLGVRSVTWAGSRLSAPTQEDAFNGTGVIIEIERFYEKSFPRQWFSPRKALLETAITRTNIPDILNPGMSEAQVAAMYGALPTSYWFDYSNKPFTASDLTFVDYRYTAGLPTGGSNNQYYLRATGGTVGNVIVNVNGTWIEYTWDSVHLTQEGATAVATKFASYLLTLGI